MLIKLKANIPEIILGVLLAVAIFAMGMLFESPHQTVTNSNVTTAENTPNKITDWLLVILNFSLVGSTLLLWKASNRSAKIAQRALTELERPWLVLEGATISRRELPGQQLIPNNWYIKLKWRNIGRSPALIDALVFRIIDKDEISATPDYTGGQILNCVATLAAGASFETQEVGPTIGTKNGQPIFYVFFGRMTYRQLSGGLHHTGFALEVSPHIAAFSSHPNAAYDYYT